MLSFFLNFFSKFTWKQNLLFLLGFIAVIGAIGYFINNQIKKTFNNDYYKFKLKNNANKTVKYLNKNKVLPSSFPFNLATNLIEYNEVDEEKRIIKSLQEKYSSYIDADFLVKNKLEKIKKINFEKNKNLKIKEMGIKAFERCLEQTMIDKKIYTEGCLVLLDEGEVLYLDAYIDSLKYGIGIIFLPFHKVFYPNNFYSSEEHFKAYKEEFMKLLQKAREQNIYIFQIPEKIYNLEYHDGEWEYRENYTGAAEEEILNDEEKYGNFFLKYLEIIFYKENPFVDFIRDLKENKAKIYF